MKHALTVSLLVVLGVRLVCFLLLAPQPVDGQQVAFISTILDEPQVTYSSQSFTVMFGNFFGGVPVRITTKPSNQLEYGKIVKISGSLTFSVLRSGRRLLTIATDNISVVPSPQDKLIQSVIDIRKSIKNVFQNLLSTNSATLLLGIVLGVKGKFTPQFLTGIQTTGTSHIIAASGMNVTMVGGFFFAVFAKFFRRQWAIILVGIGVGWYILLAGLQPSIVRAGAMMVYSLSAQLFGRQYSGVYALVLTGGLLLFFSPSLLFDVGFQLSVTATAGIMFIKPLFPRHVLFDDISTTVAAQLATLPILLSQFGKVGVLSVIVNALILWTIPFLMILGGFAAMSAIIFPMVAGVFLYVAAPLLWYMEVVIDFFAAHSPVVVITNVPSVLIIGYYVCLVGIVWVGWTRRKSTNLPPLQLHLQEQ